MRTTILNRPRSLPIPEHDNRKVPELPGQPTVALQVLQRADRRGSCEIHAGTVRLQVNLKSRALSPNVVAKRLTIGEVARRTGVATSALRFYEDKGLITSERADTGHRRYRRDTIRRVSFILTAQRIGLTLDQIARALEQLPSRRTPSRRDWTTVAANWRPLLDERINALTQLRDRLDGCIGCGCLSLDTCALHNPDDTAATNGPGPRYLLGDSTPA
ncbi:MAG: redox-sensitive transcriptional activator SoxR [Acidobacteria bacterium]|nr:redox-sensitive transcriptional activator SoxR [Acidobacteriota bacterium]